MAQNKGSQNKSRKPVSKSNGIPWLLQFSQELSFSGTKSLKTAFWVLSAACFLWMQWAASGTGINGDDKMQNEYEQALISWYASSGADTTALNLPKTKMHYYGGLFEVTSGMANRALGYDSPDKEGYHKVRHAFIALFGWAALLFIGLTAAFLGGWEIGIIALVFGFLTPGFMGQGLMNPKDMPFAAGYIASLYFLLRWLKEMPSPGKKILWGLGLSLGVALGVRVGGFLLVAIMGFFALLRLIGEVGLSGLFGDPARIGRYALFGGLPVLGGLVLALVFWPYALQDPVANMSAAFSEMSKYGVNIRLLFNGDMVFAQSLPWDYLPRWVLVTVPLFILLGWLLALAGLPVLVRRYGPLSIGLLGFAFLFPFFWVIYQGATLYDGWRHMLFPYTSGVVLSALGVGWVASAWSSRRWFKPAVLGLVGLLALDPLVHTVRNPFITYVYFNPLQGGVKGAIGEYETDYWGVSVKQGLRWLEDQGIIGENVADTVYIASNFAYPLEKYLAKYEGKVKPVYVRYRQRHDAPWDYGLFQSRFIDGSYIRKGSWPPSNTVHTIDVDGAPVLAIMKNKGSAAFEGVNAQKQNRFEESLPFLEQAVAEVPDDEVAWVALAFSYLNSNRLDSCKVALDKVLEVDPENISAWNYYGLYHMNRNETDQAVSALETAVRLQENNFFAYFYLANLELQRNNLPKALEHGKLAVSSNPGFRGAYELVASIYRAMGDTPNADAYLQAASQLK